MYEKLKGYRKSLLFGLIIILVAITLFPLIASLDKEENIEYRTDRQPIIDRFPNLGNFQSCYWKAGLFDSDSRIKAPGPTPYWMKGFVFLSNEDVLKLKNEFQWEYVGNDWQPSLDTDILQLESFKWFYSEEFNEFIKKPSYLGDFYLDIDNGLIYFDVQK